MTSENRQYLLREAKAHVHKAYDDVDPETTQRSILLALYKIIQVLEEDSVPLGSRRPSTSR